MIHCIVTLLSLLATRTNGYPYKWITTSPKDLTTITVGDSGPMSASSFIAGSSDCVVDMSATFAGSSTYRVKVTATTASAMLLQVDAGSFTATGAQLVSATTPARKISNTKNGDKNLVMEVLWNSPSTGVAKFDSVCISGYEGKAWKGSQLTSTFDAAATAPVYSPAPSATTTTPSSSAGSGSGTVNTDGATLHSDLTASAIVSADKTTVDFILTSKRNAWVAFGVTNPTGGGMTGSGKGSDVVICMKGGAAQRFAITTKTTPTGGVEMAGSSCTFANGGVVMKFSRKVVAAEKELALTPGTAQALIWALGAVGDVDLSARHDARGETSIDVAAMSAGGKIELKAPNWALWLHIICMGSAWGLLLPWGVAIANRLRNVEKDEYPGGWFYLHKKLQYIGWFLQLLGFIFVVVYVAMEGGAHFSNPHMILGLVVTILGTLQPLNALFRPHNPVAGEEKSKARVMWEYLHKGSGWIAVIFGMLNVFLGALLTNVLGFNSSPLVLGMIIGVLGLLTVGCFLISSCVSPNNGWSVFCIRLTPKKKIAEGVAVP